MGAVRRCPICGKAEVAEYRPFCSRRCADIDLGRWLTGSYVLPGEPADPEGPDAPRPPTGDDPG
jgi:endogenous inhibitor of DNA gyrase (YacG/DUF329 family)